MPTNPRPKKSQQAAAALQVAPKQIDDIQPWDEYVEEASPDVTPWRKRLPDGEVLEVGCPTSEQIDRLYEGMRREDSLACIVALFGEDDGAKVIELTARQPFTVRFKLINDVMMHYGMSLAQLPESIASSN